MALTILGIETSCDETAAGVVDDGRTLRSNVLSSQAELHSRYGGVVPELASRQHVRDLTPVLERSVAACGLALEEVDAVAVTYGPGLAGSLLTGLNAAKALAYALGKPLIGVNHLEAHLYAAWLTPHNPAEDPGFPLAGLVASGGHTDLLLMEGHGQYRLIGRTRDDAAGEAFDKAARILGLGFPGGPEIQRTAQGATGAVSLPRAWLRDTHDFSFSGLKTALLHLAQERGVYLADYPNPKEEGIAKTTGDGSGGAAGAGSDRDVRDDDRGGVAGAGSGRDVRDGSGGGAAGSGSVGAVGDGGGGGGAAGSGSVGAARDDGGGGAAGSGSVGAARGSGGRVAGAGSVGAAGDGGGGGAAGSGSVGAGRGSGGRVAGAGGVRAARSGSSGVVGSGSVGAAGQMEGGMADVVRELAWAFQESVVDVVSAKLVDMARKYGVKGLVLGGGVTANARLREEILRRSPLPVIIPPPSLCTDNGAMVAACAYYQLQRGEQWPLDLDVAPGLPLG